MPASEVFHRDFKPTPYWWEAYRPTAQDPVDAQCGYLAYHRSEVFVS